MMGTFSDELTPEQWALVDQNWQNASIALNDMIDIYREHREQEDCAHPACGSQLFEVFMNELGEIPAKIMLHVAVNRLETMRLEKEAGL